MCLRLSDISFSVENRGLFNNLNAEFKRGFNLIYGPSGSGKTSLLKLINALYVPQKGTIYYKNIDITTFKPCIWRSICMLTLQKSLFLEGSILENIKLPFSFKVHKDKKLDEKLLDEMLTLLGFDRSILDANLLSLSGGEAQRLGIIRSVLLGAEVYLFDEPTSALDKEMEEVVFSFIGKLSKKHICIVCSHSDKAFRYADKVFELVEGGLRVG